MIRPYKRHKPKKVSYQFRQDMKKAYELIPEVPAAHQVVRILYYPAKDDVWVDDGAVSQTDISRRGWITLGTYPSRYRKDGSLITPDDVLKAALRSVHLYNVFAGTRPAIERAKEKKKEEPAEEPAMEGMSNTRGDAGWIQSICTPIEDIAKRLLARFGSTDSKLLAYARKNDLSFIQYIRLCYSDELTAEEKDRLYAVWREGKK